MTFFFQWSTSPSSVAIFQHHQRMEFTFHNYYIILELLPSSVIFWRAFSCWQGYVAPRLKTSLHKFYGRHHNLVDHYEISIYQITMDLLLFYVDVFFPPSLPRLLLDFWLYIWITRWVSYMKQELLTIHEHLSSPPVFWWGPYCSYF
jgi:hypothetical protein